MILNRRKLLGSGAGITATGLAAAACGGGSSSASPSGGTSGAASSSSTPVAPQLVSSGSPSGSSSGATAPADADPNGVINLINEEAFEHLDPQNIYVNNSQAIGRLMFRQLMGWTENGATGTFQLTPDLAAAMPTVNADNTVWTFKLRTGVKYQDGTPVTAQDLKYGVERSMDPNIPYGPQYAKNYLKGAATYTGPAKGKDLASIVCPDAQTIVFTLEQPVGTWGELCTMTTFTPVPKAKDTGKNYDLNPVCMGPYMIQSYSHDTNLVLVPNPHWDKSTDPLRSQNFKQVNVKMNVNPDTVDQEMFSDGQGGTLATFDSPQPANVVKAVGSSYSSRTFEATLAFVNYTQVSTLKTKALKDVRVRQALVYARNPSASLKVAGGTNLFYQAHSLVPPFLQGWGNYPDQFSDVGPTGNPAKAKQLLAAAGVTNLELTTPYENLPASEKAAQVKVQAYARAGITLIPKPISPNSYYTTISNPANLFDLYNGAWGYDIPDASTIFPPLFRGGSNIYNGSSNYASTSIPALDKQMAKAVTLQPAAALPIWFQVQDYLIKNAIAIPNLGYKYVVMVGSKVKGSYVSPVLGNLDITNAYISKT